MSTDTEDFQEQRAAKLAAADPEFAAARPDPTVSEAIDAAAPHLPAVVEAVRRTGRLVTVHESWVSGGIGAEVVAAVAEACPEALRAPAVRLGTAPVPTPSGKVRPHALPKASGRATQTIPGVHTMSVTPGGLHARTPIPFGHRGGPRRLRRGVRPAA